MNGCGLTSLDSFKSIEDHSFSVGCSRELDTRSFSEIALATSRTRAADKTVRDCFLTISKRQYEGPKSRHSRRKEPLDSLMSAVSSDVVSLRGTLPALDRQSSISPKFPQQVMATDVSAAMVKDAMIRRMREHDKSRKQLRKGKLQYYRSFWVKTNRNTMSRRARL
jgi:hypothetical protein